MYSFDIELFQSLLLGPEPDKRLSEYWEGNRTTTWFKDHPLLSKLSKDELNFIIPLECHGDDAEMHKRRSFAICTVASALLGAGIATWDHKLLLSCFDNSVAGESTATEIDCWICWGLVCAAAGVYLDHDWYGQAFSPDYMPALYAKAGKQIAGPFRFVFAGHKGDQKYLHACYKFENYWTSEEMCRSCAASNLHIAARCTSSIPCRVQHLINSIDIYPGVERWLFSYGLRALRTRSPTSINATWLHVRLL